MEIKSGETTVNSKQTYCSGEGGESYPKYKGVRKRKWGKWVSEIRLPNSRERIWLGSYDTAEKAARAFDAAQFCLRGGYAHFNFPESPPNIPGGRSLSPQEIQVVAARFAEQEQDHEHGDEHAGHLTADDHHDHYNYNMTNISESPPSQDPNPTFPPVISDQQHCYGSNYMSSTSNMISTTTADHETTNNNNTDWSCLNFLDYSIHDGAPAGYDHNFDHYPLFSGQLDKMHSDEYFCTTADPVLPAAAAPDDCSTRGDENIFIGDDLIFSHQYSSSFLWNF
ncbi:Ethylene-responsive transcription factor [Morus notabilis]|uniref:Dehydration responsive element binding transcription factor n=1 Tax=Morus notabilis TaxID=981085 RepID=W6FHL0_9ROSA|nr:ethylene-responsive transcription factor ERF016 [Morus notabilis]AHJ25974.1 dehydration responsive element binding transcription factor [Morus notabilis]EXB74920.1 Ethylene-responsive transcription factor [Morus notabilis]